MLLTPQPTHHQPAEMISFYKQHFNNVHALHCGKCKNTIAIELSEPLANDLLGLKPHPNGVIVLPVDERLLGSRFRIDGMLGYLCVCGNDTRASEIEELHSPTGEFLPHEVAAIQNHMQTSGWQAPVRQKNGKEHRDTFVAERL